MERSEASRMTQELCDKGFLESAPPRDPARGQRTAVRPGRCPRTSAACRALARHGRPVADQGDASDPLLVHGRGTRTVVGSHRGGDRHAAGGIRTDRCRRPQCRPLGGRGRPGQCTRRARRGTPWGRGRLPHLPGFRW
ncbi:hypothetical protein ACFU98_37300 [Streptomyces sp. NPDC057575]|uniref:hypothetical protein n=1 Tax=unclassified Streptomyces TaxID=2593676 RepID=UPI0036801EFF